MQNRKIIVVPIESLEERYSLQWKDWFEKEFSVHCLYDTHMILVNKQGKYVLKSGNLSKFGSKRRSAMDCGVEKITH